MNLRAITVDSRLDLEHNQILALQAEGHCIRIFTPGYALNDLAIGRDGLEGIVDGHKLKVVCKRCAA